MNGREPEAVRLSIVPEGKTVKVRELLTTGSMRRRLLDMGLIEGTRVSCLQKSPGRGPGRLSHPGAVVALRSEDSSQILVDGLLN